MEEVKVTIQDIVSVFKNTNEKKRLKDIKAALVERFRPEGELLFPEQNEIELQVETLVKQDKKLGIDSELVFSNGFYKKRKRRPAPSDGDNLPSDYMGRAGECAVISELLFHGYNANHMMVDNGVDIVAVKNNVYYYIQVKTVNIRNGVVYAQIGNEKYDQYINTQMRYFIVARYKDNGVIRNMFFQLTPSYISQAIYEGAIKQGSNSLSIKIKFNDKTGAPILYDNKELPFGFFKDNFNL